MTFAVECEVFEVQKSPGVDNSYSLDDTLEYVDPPQLVLNLCTPELKAMEFSMEILIEEYDKQQYLVIDTSGCLGDERQCNICSSTPPPSEMKTFFQKK